MIGMMCQTKNSRDQQIAQKGRTLRNLTNLDRNFSALLDTRYAEGKLICMGLDPDYDKLPDSVLCKFGGDEEDLIEQAVAYLDFCTKIVDATHDLVAAFKPNTAFFEDAGPMGYEMLRLLVRHIHRVAPDVVVILDAKRADIGKTNTGTARFLFDILGADAVTVNPYFGEEALAPFLERADKGVIVLCRTSNPGAGELQNVMVVGSDNGTLGAKPMPFYKFVASKIRGWRSKARIAVVVGATAPDELAETRAILTETTILIPGVGTQGGDLKTAIMNGVTTELIGALLNIGSKGLYASSGDDFAQATRAHVMEMNLAIRSCLEAA